MVDAPFFIRRMQLEDAVALAAAFASWNKPPEQYTRYWQQNVDGSRITLIAWVGDDVAGYGNLLWESDYPPFYVAGIPEINDLNTLNPFRRRGIATAIIRECEQIATANGKPIMGIGVGKTPDYGNALRLYPQLGYVFDGRGPRPTPWGDEEYLTKRLLPE